MKDLTIIGIFFAQILCTIIITLTFLKHIQFLKLYFELSEKYLNLIRKKEFPIYYSSEAIKKKAFRKLWHLKPKKEVVLSCAAIKNMQQTLPLIKKQAKKEQASPSFLLLYAEISYLSYDYNLCQTILTKLEKIKLKSKYLKMRYLRLQALDELYQTDMLSASQHISKVLTFYQKKGFLYEEADCYQILAQTYRISGIFDVAYTMLKEAEKIYKEIKLPLKIAETEAYLGLNELGRENYKTATEYFLKAAKTCQNKKFNNLNQDINNWLGLTAYLTKDYANAEKYLKTALKNSNSPTANAFSTELLARLYFIQNHEEQALKYITQSLTICSQKHLSSGYFENQYLRAQIYYNQKKYQLSRQILTDLIKTKTPPNATYYPANAYTLLGTIEYQEGHLEKAKTLFKQALDLEHSRNRLKGAAIDYNNLAEISRQIGDINEANSYIKQAIKYAKEIKDKELEQYLTQKVELTNRPD